MSSVALVGGLVINAAYPRLHPGTLQECLNFEVTLNQGYTLVRGFQRYDGKPLPEVDTTGLTNAQANAAWKQAFDDYRPTVAQVPGFDPLALTFFQDQVWVVTHSEEFSVASADPLVDDIAGLQAFQEAAGGDGPAGIIVNKTAGDTFEIAWVRRPEDPITGFAIRFLTEIEFDQGTNVPDSGVMADNGIEVTVRGLEIRSGDSAQGTAAGVLWVQLHTTAPAQGSTLTQNGSSLRVLSTRGVSSINETEATELNALAEPSVAGILVRTTPSGWKVIDMGFELPFAQGQVLFDTVYSAGAAIDDDIAIEALPEFQCQRTTTADASLPDYPDDIPPTQTDWSFSETERHWFRNVESLTGAKNILNNVGNEYVYSPLTSVETTISRVLRLSDWIPVPFSNEPDQRLTGFELELIVSREVISGDAADTKYRLHDVRIELPTGQVSSNKAPATEVESDSTVTITIGSNQDTWGLGAINRDQINENFRILIQARGVGAVETQGHFRIHRARLTVYTRTLTGRVVVRRGSTDIGTLTALYAAYETGRVADGDAAGALTARMFRDMAGNEIPFSDIQAGDELYGGPDGGSGLIAVVDGAPSKLRLPGRAALEAEDSKYQFIDSNFFGSEFLEAVYGVSGAGRAFTFNDHYFFFIRTGGPEAFAKPRHVARSGALRLALGYDTGNVELSRVGHPDDFDGVAGAILFGTGEKVMGLAELPGDALAIISRRSIRVFLEGQLQTISPNAGALEYSASTTDRTIFADQWGVATINAVQQYGDFAMGRMSDVIASRLQPRLQGQFGHKLRCVEVTRSNNQYQMFFDDGINITMSMTHLGPQFTEQSYFLDTVDNVAPVKAVTAGITKAGEERLFMLLDGSDYLYWRNVGPNFDGVPIRARIMTNPFIADSESRNKRFNVLHTHGRAETEAEVTSAVGADYQRATQSGRKVQFGRPGDAYVIGGRPAFTKTNHNVRGKDVALEFSYLGDASAPFILQAFEWVDISPLKLER